LDFSNLRALKNYKNEKMKKNYVWIIFLLSVISIQTSFGQIYSADFSNDGDGFADHTTSSPPATGPASVGPFGTAPNQWSLSYDTAPNSDTTANSFKVSGGALVSEDWGGQGIFLSQTIDVSAISAVNIAAIGVNVGANDGNFTYFYILDGGARVETAIGATVNADPVNYTINNLDVSGNTSIQVGFEFSENGSGDGYSISSFEVAEVTGNPAPTISNISSSTLSPIPTDNVTITADFTDADGIASATLRWGTTSGSLTNNISMSNTSGDTYSGTIPAQVDGTTVFYTVEATDSNAAPETTVSNENNYLVLEPMVTPYEIDFTTTNPSNDNWSYYSVSGNEEWTWNNGSGVEMNAFNGGCQTNEDWFITPPIDLTVTFSETMKFTLEETFDGTTLEALYSTDYSGAGDPNLATWTSIGTYSSGTTVTTNRLSIINPSTTKTYVAFKYVFSTGNCSRFTIKNFELKDSFTWNGGADNDWENASNWRVNRKPTAGGVVTISSTATTFPTITSAILDVERIKLSSPATLIAETTINADIEYSRNLNTADWKLLSAPVSNVTAERLIELNSFATGTAGNIGLGFYNNNGTTPWNYQVTTGAIDNARGMAVKINASSIKYEGKLNTGPVSINLTTGDRTNFNLIGNPFTAYLNSTAFLNHFDNTLALSEQTIWLWDGSQYITKNLANPIEIAVSQGFFVNAAFNNIPVTMNPVMISHQSADTFMRQEPKPSFELFVENGDTKKGTKVFFVEGKTTGWDNGYDSSMFGGATHDFGVFTQLVSNDEGKKLAIQTLPSSDVQTMVIPVGLIAEANKEVTFSVAATNLPSGVEIYLEDRVNNTFTNLSEGNHTITTKTAVNGIGQYYIHTSAKLSTDDISQNIANVSIYNSAKNEITVAGLQAKANVKVFSLLGEELVNTSIESNGVSKIALPNLSTGVYVVKLNSALGNMTKKIILE
jgi:hypothetical protein